MSELKVRFIDDTYVEYYNTGKHDLAQIYLKSESDKVIAELQKEARHHKYKRCLAMAEACMHKRWRPDEGFDYARSTRHMKKWLAIAEKFKEAK